MNYGVTVDTIGMIISYINIIIELCIFLKINNMYKTEINPSNSQKIIKMIKKILMKIIKRMKIK